MATYTHEGIVLCYSPKSEPKLVFLRFSNEKWIDHNGGDYRADTGETLPNPCGYRLDLSSIRRILVAPEGTAAVPPHEPMTLSELAAALQALGWSNRELGRRIGCSDWFVRSMLGGSNPVPVELARWLRRAVAWIERNPVPTLGD